MLRSCSSPLANIAFRRYIPALLQYNNYQQQQERSFYWVVKLRKPPPKTPVNKRHKPSRTFDPKDVRYLEYDEVEKVELAKQPEIELLLLKPVKKLGNAGEIISINQVDAYHKLLVPGFAVYPTDRNKAKFKDQILNQHKYSSKTALIILEYLETMVLLVTMNKENPWKIEPWHIRACFRKSMINVPADAIEMPDKEITGPNMDLQSKDFYVTLTINKCEKIKVRCRLHHEATNSEECLPVLDNYDEMPSEPIFEEDREILDSMPAKWKATLKHSI